MAAFGLCPMCMSLSDSRQAKRAVVVGGGVGGLVTATRLAQSGFSVRLLEKNEVVGGRLSETTLETTAGRFRYDTGPSLLLLPDVYRQTFADLGVNADELLELTRLDPNYRVFRDGEQLDIRSDVVDMRDELEAIEEGASAAWERYLRSAEAFFDGGFPSFIERDGWKVLAEADLGAWTNMLTRGGNPLESHRSALERLFQSEILRGAASFQDLYVGLSPSRAPAVFSLLSALEAKQGVWYSMGGMVRVRDALVQLAESAGVEIRTSTAVKRVIAADGVATAVELEGGGREDGDVFVLNADVPYAERRLLEDGTQAKRRYSSGVVNLMLAVHDPCPGLAHHNIFLAEDSAKSWEGIFEPGLHLPDDGNMYVHVPSRSDPTAAPPGCSSVMCLIPCGLLPGDEDALLAAATDRAMDRLQRFFPRHAVHAEASYTPRHWNHTYNLEQGAAFGLAHDIFQLSFFRPPFRSRKLSNVFFVGASTRPGNGVPLVMISARLCTEQILAEYSLIERKARR